MNVSLPDQMKSWAESRTSDGTYANVSDYIRDLIRKDQAVQSAISDIQPLIDEGISSGPARPFDVEGFVRDKGA